MQPRPSNKRSRTEQEQRAPKIPSADDAAAKRAAAGDVRKPVLENEQPSQSAVTGRDDPVIELPTKRIDIDAAD